MTKMIDNFQNISFQLLAIFLSTGPCRFVQSNQYSRKMKEYILVMSWLRKSLNRFRALSFLKIFSVYFEWYFKDVRHLRHINARSEIGQQVPDRARAKSEKEIHERCRFIIKEAEMSLFLQDVGEEILGAALEPVNKNRNSWQRDQS